MPSYWRAIHQPSWRLAKSWIACALEVTVLWNRRDASVKTSGLYVNFCPWWPVSADTSRLFANSRRPTTAKSVARQAYAEKWSRRRGSNPHGTKYHWILSPARLPVPPLRGGRSKIACPLMTLKMRLKQSQGAVNFWRQAVSVELRPHRSASWFAAVTHHGRVQMLSCLAHENVQRAVHNARDAAAIRSVVFAVGFGGWQWRVVVPVFADESRP